LGGNCANDTTTFCLGNNVCSNTTKVCVAPTIVLPVGGSNCSAMGYVCAAGLDCIGTICKVRLGESGCKGQDSNCVTGVCTTPGDVCKIGVGIGAWCPEPTTFCLNPPGVCDGGFCKVPLGKSGCQGNSTNCLSGVCTTPGDICKTGVALGGSCADATTTFCLGPNVCNNTTKVCVAPTNVLPIGSGDCRVGGNVCVTNAICDIVDGICKFPIGSTGCSANITLCQIPAACVNNVCVLQEGESVCVNDEDCDAGLDCVAGVCQDSQGVIPDDGGAWWLKPVLIGGGVLAAVIAVILAIVTAVVAFGAGAIFLFGGDGGDGGDDNGSYSGGSSHSR
jgi:hypothetical protein